MASLPSDQEEARAYLATGRGVAGHRPSVEAYRSGYYVRSSPERCAALRAKWGVPDDDEVAEVKRSPSLTQTPAQRARAARLSQAKRWALKWAKTPYGESISTHRTTPRHIPGTEDVEVELRTYDWRWRVHYTYLLRLRPGATAKTFVLVSAIKRHTFPPTDPN